MNAISAVVYREAKIRATNFTFIFWDLFFPLLYMLVFGVGINTAIGAPTGLGNVNYNEFFPGGNSGHGQFCHRLQYFLVVFP